MQEKPLGIGVIGAGFMGKTFAQICTQLPEALLAGLCDAVPAVGERAAAEFGAPFYTEPNALIGQPDVDAVIVATPEDRHVEPTLAALRAGKSVLVEKPLAGTSADARLLLQAAQASKGTLMVGHVLRFATAFATAKQLVDAGQIGAVQSMHTRRLNGKSAQDRLQGRCSLPIFLGVHDYDLVRWFAGSEPQRIYAESQFGVLAAEGYDIEDTNWALITFENGVLAACETGWILPRGHASGSDQLFVVQGTQGRLEVNLQRQGLVLSSEERTSYPDTTFMPRIDGELRAGFVHETRHFLRCARTGEEPLIRAHDAYIALAMAETIMESAKSHQPINFAAGLEATP